MHKEIRIHSKSGPGPFPSIRAPTPLIYAILCEQDEILFYLLTTKHPDLSIRVKGWTPLHFSASTVSHKCLELLLKFECIQNNIDERVEEPMTHIPQGQGTTALHIAVTNRRHASVLLLTQDLELPEFDLQGQKIDSRAEREVFPPANALQLSAHGNMAIHIAAYQRDWDMCQILLHAADDSTVRNNDGKTPADIAREKMFLELAEKLEQNQVDPIDVLRLRYFPPLPRMKKSKNVAKVVSFGESEEEEDEPEYATTAEVAELRRSVHTLSKMVQQLTVKVAALEDRKFDAQAGTKAVISRIVQRCRGCGLVGTRHCPTCAFYFCSTCWLKPSHSCLATS
jgi:ankyrin repeat protein